MKATKAARLRAVSVYANALQPSQIERRPQCRESVLCVGDDMLHVKAMHGESTQELGDIEFVAPARASGYRQEDSVLQVLLYCERRRYPTP